MQSVMKTLPKQISLFTEAELTSSQGDFPASHTQWPESDLEKKMSDTSGRRCLERFEKFSRVGSWAKTFSALLIGQEGWYSTRCRLTWKLKGTKFNRMYFQLVPSTHRTEETEFGLLPTVTSHQQNTQFKQGGTCLQAKLILGMLPTPQAMDSMTNPPRQITQSGRIISNQGHNGSAPLKDLAMNGLLHTPTAMDSTNATATMKSSQVKEGSMHSVTLTRAMAMGMLPTPNQRDYKDNIGNGKDAPSIGVTRGYSLGQKVNSMLPTPMASDCGDKVTGLENQDSLTKRARLETGTTSQLNPQFVLEMMGFPPDWTELPFLNGETNP